MLHERIKMAAAVWAGVGIWLGTVGISATADEPPKVFKAGFAERDISPKIGDEAPGGYGKAYHQSFRDPCMARAAVFDDGKNRVAIVGIDALFIRAKTVNEIREAIEKKCGIPGDSVLIGASHTHSGGPIGLFLPGEFDDASDLIKRLVYEESVIADADYLEKAKTGIIDAVVEADAKRVDAKGNAGFGLADHVAFNRRFQMKQGHAMTHPGQGNPDIIEPSGPTDPQVGVLGAWDLEGKFLGCVVNFACHGTTGPGGISSDYIGHVVQTVRSVMGEDAGVVFVNGFSGDVTQVNNQSPYQIAQFGDVSARFVGGQVGAEALKALLVMEQGAAPLGPVVAKTETLKLKRRPPSAEHLAEALKIVEEGDASKADATTRTFAKETVVLGALIDKEPEVDAEVQAIQVGPVVLLSTSAEYFCQYGLDLKAASAFPIVFPVSLANGVIGYVPHESAFAPDGGGYETRLTAYSTLEITAGRAIADALLKLSNSLTPGATPTPPPLPPFKGQPWGYGNLPAQLD